MVDKDAMFDELSKNFPAANYFTFCNKMSVGYNEARTMLTRWKEDYNVALRDLLAQWDQRMNGVTRKQLEDALEDAEVGALCSIVRKHYDKAASRMGGGDGAVHANRNQSINQSSTSDAVHEKQRGSSNMTAASVEEEDDDIIHSPENIRNQAGQAATVRQRVSHVTSAAPAEEDDNDDDGDDDDDVVYKGGGTAKSQTQQMPAVRRRGEVERKQDRRREEQGGLMMSNLKAVDPVGGGERGVDPTSIKVERTTETKDGNKSTMTFVWTGVSKEQITLLGIVLCVGVGLFFLNRRKN